MRPDRKLNLYTDMKLSRKCQNKEYCERHLNFFLFAVKDNWSKKNSINAFYFYDTFESIVYDKYNTKDGREDMEVYLSWVFTLHMKWYHTIQRQTVTN